jgi:hypothetical protein
MMNLRIEVLLRECRIQICEITSIYIIPSKKEQLQPGMREQAVVILWRDPPMNVGEGPGFNSEVSL